jgi:hypothetical protein
MSRTIPTVWLYGRGLDMWANVEEPTPASAPIRLDHARWCDWLETRTTTRFAYPLTDRSAGWIAL